jgi:hypothetical protein
LPNVFSFFFQTLAVARRRRKAVALITVPQELNSTEALAMQILRPLQSMSEIKDWYIRYKLR